MNKKAMRKKIIELRDQYTSEEIKEKSKLIAANLFCIPEYQLAKSVMFFITFGSEVDTREMVEETIQRNKAVLVPKALPETRELIPSLLLDYDKDLEPGAYNIPEPRKSSLRPYKPDTIDLLLVPGVAFDQSGNRLGYGGGYYDRFFELLKPKTPLVALVFDMQICESIPVEKWDHPVDVIVTEKRIIRIT
jgi:5-formyltetrahydrofolate cyclo-ligase